MANNNNTASPGARIKSLRVARGFSLEQLHEESGIGRSTIAAWESGQNKLHFHRVKHRTSVKLIASALGATEDSIWGVGNEAGNVNGEISAPIQGILPDTGGNVAKVIQGHSEVAPEGLGSMNLPTSAHDLIPLLVLSNEMAPRICRGAAIAVHPSTIPRDGNIQIVEQDGICRVCGVEFANGEWVLVTPTSEPVKFTGIVLADVIRIEFKTSATGRVVEEDSAGIWMKSSQRS